MEERHSRDAVTSRMRLRDYDYALPGNYFVTLCTEKRQCLFGDVVDDEMILSPAGAMIDSWLVSVPRRFPDAALDSMVVMPNHLHAIISLKSTLEEPGRSHKLSDIIHWFKTKTTRDYSLGVRRAGWPRFPRRLWQQRFHDHIVRTDQSLERIRRYIESNPANWPNDENHPTAILG